MVRNSSLAFFAYTAAGLLLKFSGFLRSRLRSLSEAEMSGRRACRGRSVGGFCFSLVLVGALAGGAWAVDINLVTCSNGVDAYGVVSNPVDYLAGTKTCILGAAEYSGYATGKRFVVPINTKVIFNNLTVIGDLLPAVEIRGG